MLTQEKIAKLIERAKLARENAFVHRSGHPIGACVLTTDDHYFEGCNTESVISGMGTCAERSAIDHAVIHGKYEFSAIAVVDSEKTFPCGSCLQYLLLYHQITDMEIEVIVADLVGNYEVRTLHSLLPEGYETEHNLEQIRQYRNKPDLLHSV